MNRDESIALWKQGKDVWNEWANGMLAERKRLEDAGEWEAERTETGKWKGYNQKTQNWMNESHSDFSHLFFQTIEYEDGHQKSVKESDNLRPVSVNSVDFKKFIFPGTVTFNNTVFETNDAVFAAATFFDYVQFSTVAFKGNTLFTSATFKQTADFFRASFCGFTSFTNAIFLDDVKFANCRFKNVTGFGSCQFNGITHFSTSQFEEIASFSKTVFYDNALFDLVHFENPITFQQAIFKSSANFTSITSDRSFNLLQTNFTFVPDFTEAAFHAPPVLDEVKLSEPMAFRMWNWNKGSGEPRSGGMSVFKTANHPTDTRKYRALTKMATEAKDYQNEMKFFADEQRCRRFWHDKPFGKGAGRFWFGLVYEKVSDFGRSFWRPLAGWLISTTIFASLYALTSQGKITDWFDPIYISIRHGLIFSGLTRSEHWDSAITALYTTAKGDKSTIDISNTAASLMLAQPIISAVFIFLFLLAVRNQFKIR